MTPSGLFRIGDVARLFDLSVSSIRHYEVLGLVTPEYTDPDSGYRYYGPNQFERFNTIRYLRALDMPLSEIADFLQNRDVERIEEKLRKQQETLRLKMDELQRVSRKIDKRLAVLAEARGATADVIEEVILPPARMYRVNRQLQIRNYRDMELPTIHLAQAQPEALIFLGKVGVGISREHIMQGRFDSYDGVFLMLDEADHFSGDICLLPERRCIRLRFHGTHIDAPQHYRTLADYMASHNLMPAGDSEEITLIDYGITNDTEKFLTEISIPVEAKGE